MATIANPRDIILAPVVSEKSYGLMEQNVYTFFVDRDANKTQIKIAVEEIFGVKVAKVRTIQYEGKMKRRGRQEGRRPNWKKAYVTLKKGEPTVDYAEAI